MLPTLSPPRFSRILRSFPRLRRSVHSASPPWLSPHGGPQKGSKVIAALSGGVDSSVTLALLTDPALGLDVRGVFMRNWARKESEEYEGEGCEWEKDWEDVRRVCQVLGVECEMVDLSNEYWIRVFEPSIDSWKSGETPNPDVSCNREIKFGALMDRMIKTPDTFLATGHYAGLAYTPPTPSGPSRTRLVRSHDPTKDQTYYLSSVPEPQLAKAVFPLSHTPKSQVRELARKFGLPTAEREESMGVCFVGERGRFGDFVSQYTSSPSSSSSGDIVSPTGLVLGQHQGLWHYTIGQKAKLSGMQEKWFVARKEVEGNRLVVVPGADHPALMCTELVMTGFQWVWEDHPPPEVFGEEGLRAMCAVRHRMRGVPVRAFQTPDGQVKIEFEKPENAVAKGQVAVLWVEEVEGSGDWGWCLGSGVIGGTKCLDEE